MNFPGKMTSAAYPSAGYSVEVRLELSVSGRMFRIGQLGPDFLILVDRADLPPSRGEITVSIGGRIRRWNVQLPKGVSSVKQICPITRYAH
jgi:hypothetical protein